MKKFAILLMGPTGSGKSNIAIELAQTLPLEIISVDSAQIYRQMDIGTAKPSAASRAQVQHHLIDIRDPSERYSAGEFLRDAAVLMREIWTRGRHPLLVGGTMLYFHALTHGIAELPNADMKLRAAIDAQGEARGWAALHAELARFDPLAAARIHPNDPQRIQRALEVFRLTGRPISELQAARTGFIDGAEAVELVLAPAIRADLHARIEQRLGQMMREGFLEEVRGLYARGDLSLNLPSMRSVGYRQLWQYLAQEEEYSLDDAVRRTVIATRQLAKRQWTWLRRRPEATWFDAVHPDVTRDVKIALSRRISATLTSV